MKRIRIRPYIHETDEPAAYRLWQETLGATWPLTAESFRRVTVGTACYRPGDALVAEAEGQLGGFVATLTSRSLRDDIMVGQITVVLVSPNRQRQGIGTRLVMGALSHLRENGVAVAQLARGAGPYFWLGVPENLPLALRFFSKLGWKFAESPAADMYQNMINYATPAYIWERLRACGVRVGIAEGQSIERVLAFEKEHFPHWYEGYASRRDTPGEIVFAETASGQVVGTALLQSPHLSPPPLWAEILGQDTGTLNAVGVDASLRKRGIGLALCARASEILRERGARYCHITGAWSASWYAKLGYQVWRTYRVSRMPLHDLG